MINTLNRYSLGNVNTDTRLFTNSLWVSSDLTGIIAAITSISCWRTAGGVEIAICSVANVLYFSVSTYVSIAGCSQLKTPLSSSSSLVHANVLIELSQVGKACVPTADFH